MVLRSVRVRPKDNSHRPVRWVINTGSQDHRWLGNDHFAAQGTEIIPLARTADTQTHHAAQQLEGLRRFLGDRLAGTPSMPTTWSLSTG